MRKLPVVHVPLRYDLRNDEPFHIALAPDEQQLVAGDPTAESGVAVGILPDTSRVVHVLWLAAADSWLPMISTFSRSGELLKAEGLIIGECAPWDEPCFQCNETVSIDREYRVLTTDTVRECKCDTAYIVSGPCERYVKVLEGFVTERGAMMSPMRRTELPDK